MPYVKTINEDGVVSDIMAVALDSELDATLLHKSELVNGFTQTTAGVNALDAAAGKSLNDSLATTASDLSDFETEVANDYALKTELSNYAKTSDLSNYLTVVSSLQYVAWQGVYTFRTDANYVDITLPCASLKSGTLSCNTNVSWNTIYFVDETNPSLGIARSVSLSVSSVIRVNRDICILRCAHPTAISPTSVYGFATNRGQFTISST